MWNAGYRNPDSGFCWIKDTIVTLIFVFYATRTTKYVYNNFMEELTPVATLTLHLRLVSYVAVIIGVILTFFVWNMFWAYSHSSAPVMRTGIRYLCTLMMWTFITSTVVFYPSPELVSYKTEKTLKLAIKNYHTDENMAKLIDHVQNTFGCCGVNDLRDWNENDDFMCSDLNEGELKCSVPPSCCAKNKIQIISNFTYINDICGAGVLESVGKETYTVPTHSDNEKIEGNVFWKGCLQKMSQRLFEMQSDLFAAIMSMFIIQTLAIAKTCFDLQNLQNAFNVNIQEPTPAG